MRGADTDRLVQRIKRERARLVSHLPRLDPLLMLGDDDDDVLQYVAVDVDVAELRTTDGSDRMLVAEGIRERADFTLYVPEWRRLYVLANDGESVAVGDGDLEQGVMAWAAVYRNGQLVASYTEPAYDGLL